MLPNSDENIQFVLKLAEASITKEALNNLLEKKKVAVGSDKDKQQLDDISMLKFTDKEINQMPKTFRKEFRADGCTARIRKKPSGKMVIFTKYVIAGTAIMYPLLIKILKKRNGFLLNS